MGTGKSMILVPPFYFKFLDGFAADCAGTSNGLPELVNL